jgi:hypothetical protein
MVVDVPTARWILTRVNDDGLRANLNIGFPYVEDGRNVCAVCLDYAADEDLEISKMVAIASERASVFRMSQTPPLMAGVVKGNSL